VVCDANLAPDRIGAAIEVGVDVSHFENRLAVIDIIEATLIGGITPGHLGRQGRFAAFKARRPADWRLVPTGPGGVVVAGHKEQRHNRQSTPHDAYQLPPPRSHGCHHCHLFNNTLDHTLHSRRGCQRRRTRVCAAENPLSTTGRAKCLSHNRWRPHASSKGAE